MDAAMQQRGKELSEHASCAGCQSFNLLFVLLYYQCWRSFLAGSSHHQLYLKSHHCCAAAATNDTKLMADTDDGLRIGPTWPTSKPRLHVTKHSCHFVISVLF
jgi:hypothetical protein